jgi:cation diffusion facilitator CzcD-associated flavoprotein CzcO
LQPEIWEYLRRVSREQHIDPHIRLNHEVSAATWDEQAEHWRIETNAGALTAEILVAGPGPGALVLALLRCAFARQRQIAPSMCRCRRA